MADSKNPECQSEAAVLARLLQASALSLGIVEPRPARVGIERAARSGEIEGLCSTYSSAPHCSAAKPKLALSEVASEVNFAHASHLPV